MMPQQPVRAQAPAGAPRAAPAVRNHARVQAPATGNTQPGPRPATNLRQPPTAQCHAPGPHMPRVQVHYGCGDGTYYSPDSVTPEAESQTHVISTLKTLALISCTDDADVDQAHLNMEYEQPQHIYYPDAHPELEDFLAPQHDENSAPAPRECAPYEEDFADLDSADHETAPAQCVSSPHFTPYTSD